MEKTVGQSTQALTQFSNEGYQCPPSWLYFGGSCYREFNTAQSWHDARKSCQDKQGELLSINSESEQNFVYQNIAVNRTLWIGLVKDLLISSFRWSSGQNITYKNWIGHDLSGNEDCGEMTDYGSFHGQWNDQHCSIKQPWICEKAATCGRFFKVQPKMQLIGHVIERVTGSSDTECLFRCQHHHKCLSVNYRHDQSQSSGDCELNDVTARDFPKDLYADKEFDYYEGVE